MLRPILNQHTYIFCTTDRTLDKDISPLGFFKEREGMTYIIKKEDADASNIEFQNEWSFISLDYVSDLEMVGLTAALSTALANENIPCNIVAAFYHDHIFVPIDMAQRAVEIIEGITI